VAIQLGYIYLVMYVSVIVQRRSAALDTLSCNVEGGLNGRSNGGFKTVQREEDRMIGILRADC